MRVLLDECVHRRLADELTGHAVTTVQEMGWSGIKNGRLLSLAVERFDALLTVDKKLPLQQHLKSFAIAVIVVQCRSNDIGELRKAAPAILHALPTAPQRTATFVG